MVPKPHFKSEVTAYTVSKTAQSAPLITITSPNALAAAATTALFLESPNKYCKFLSSQSIVTSSGAIQVGATLSSTKMSCQQKL